MKNIKRVLKFLLYILLSLIVLFSLYSLTITRIFKKDFVNIFGYTYFVVASGSMSGTMEVNDIIIVDIGADYKVDDVITFREDRSYITHRVVKIDEDRVITKGDVNKVEDDPISKDNIVGKVKLTISTSSLFKVIAGILLVLLLYLLINFDKIFKKYIFKKKEKKKNDAPLEYTQALPILKDVSENRYMVPEEKILESVDEKPVLKEVIDSIDLSIEKKFIDKILNNFKMKESKMKLTKSGSIKLKYLYELVEVIENDTDGIEEIIENAPLNDNLDYSFESIDFTKEIQDSLYEMPIYVFLKLMTYAILYDKEEYFDALFKVFKCQIRIDKEKRFITNIRHVDEVATMIERVISKIGYKAEFETERIKEKVNTNKLLRSITMDSNDEKQFVNIVLKILANNGDELKVSTDGSIKLKYIYELIYTIMINPDDINNILKDLPFEEKYDYEFDDINFTNKIQDTLYKMPIHVFFKLLIYSLLYEEDEYFDAIFKVLRYRIRNDNEFLKDNELSTSLTLIENVVDSLGAKENFKFNEIKEKIETNKIIKKIEDNNQIKICEKCGKPYITKCPNCD